MKKVGPPWLGVVVATSLSFLPVVFSIVFLFDFGGIKTKIYEATSFMDGVWNFYFCIKETVLGWIVLYSETDSTPIKILVPVFAVGVFATQLGISKEHKIKYTFSEMYESFWKFSHPSIKMKLIGVYVYVTYIASLLMLFVGILKMNFPVILLAVASIIILQVDGVKNLQDVKRWKMNIYYEENNQKSQKKEG